MTRIAILMIFLIGVVQAEGKTRKPAAKPTPKPAPKSKAMKLDATQQPKALRLDTEPPKALRLDTPADPTKLELPKFDTPKELPKEAPKKVAPAFPSPTPAPEAKPDLVIPAEPVKITPLFGDQPKADTKGGGIALSKSHSEVVKIDKRRDRVSVTDDPAHLWNKRDNVCLFRMNHPLACGTVIAVGIKGAVVQLTKHTSSIRPGDEAHYFAPERKMPDIQDENITSEKFLDVKPYSFTMALGYILSLDLMYPILHFYWTVSPSIAIGIQPGYISRGGDIPDAKLSGFGGLLSVNYFGDEYFRGLWAQFATGFYRLRASQPGLEEVLNSPAIHALLGWREDWAHGLNVGAGLGIRFLSPLSGYVTDVNYKSVHGMAQVEVGVSF